MVPIKNHATKKPESEVSFQVANYTVIRSNKSWIQPFWIVYSLWVFSQILISLQLRQCLQLSIQQYSSFEGTYSSWDHHYPEEWNKWEIPVPYDTFVQHKSTQICQNWPVKLAIYKLLLSDLSGSGSGVAFTRWGKVSCPNATSFLLEQDNYRICSITELYHSFINEVLLNQISFFLSCKCNDAFK